MRNIFDYYKQSENQLTHALFSTLANDPALLRGFIKDICGVRGAPKNLHLSVQSYPFARAYTNKEIESRSIPDAWIYNDDGFALVFEAKISDSLTQPQLTSHENTARKQGFETPRFYTITALPNAGDFENWTQITWVSIYTWLKKQVHDNIWAKNLAEYFELLEARMFENEQLNNGKITTFTGFPSYEDGYNYLVAKNTLRKALDELRKDTRLVKCLDMNPEGKSRGGITGKDVTVVWDFLPMGEDDKNFTESLHLTLGINQTAVEPMITIPHGLTTNKKDKIKELDIDGFIECCKKILENMQPILAENPHAQPILRGFQRHYPSQRSTPIMDTLIKTDLRTAFESNGKVKYQPQWLDVIYDVFCNKKSNYQMQVGMFFSYEKCPNLKDPKALDLIARSWLACEPLISLCK